MSAALFAAATGEQCHSQDFFGPYFLKGYAIMTSSPPSPERPPNRLRPDHASGPRQILTDSASAPAELAAQPLLQMPPTAAACDLAYTTALVTASPADVGCTAAMSVDPGEDPQAPSFVSCHHSGRVANTRRENAFLPPDTAPTFGSGQGCGGISLRFRNPT